MESPVFVTERELARTFDGGDHDDAWAVVQQHYEATKYAHKHDVKSGATATALELPRGRLRPWIDGNARPDSVRAIEDAREYGWLNVTYEDTQFTALNALVANVFSGGSIGHNHYRPSFVLNRRGEDSHVVDALELAGVEYQLVDDRPGRGDELRPTTDGSVLGRVLATLGAPIGPKAEQHLELAGYLEGAPDDVRRLFVACYLENRAHKHKSIIKFREERNREYLESLRALIENVAGEPVNRSENNIVLSKSAAEALGTVV